MCVCVRERERESVCVCVCVYEREKEREREREIVAFFTPQQQASVSQGRICVDSCSYYHTEIELADQTFYFTQ